MRSRLVCVMLALCLAVVGLVALPAPIPAQAMPNIVSMPDMAPIFLSANADGSMTASSCGHEPTSKPAGKWLDSDGIVRSTLPGSDSGLKCLYWNEGIGFESGLQFATRWVNDVKELVAWKNDRIFWTSPLPAPPHCERWVGEYELVNFSMGADGNIYFLMTDSNYCDNALRGVNPDTGAMVMHVSLGAGPSPYRTAGWSKVRMWTYDDRIMVVDQDGMVREFDYDGTENLSVRHQFTLPPGQMLYWLQANAEGTIFGLTVLSGSTSASQLHYYKADGSSGVIDNDYGSDGLSLTADGNVVGTRPNNAEISVFDTATDTVSLVNATPVTTGYATNFILHYLEDEDGNSLTLWHHADTSSGDTANSVDVYNATLDTTSRVFLKERKPGDPNYPLFNISSGGFEFANAVHDGDLYLAICEETGCDVYGSTATPSTEIHKIDLGVFGTPLSKSYQRFAYESQELEYVALGDSFSSGEGVLPFLPGTETDGTNECHRSEDAYPMLLDEDTYLNLNLTKFVACSGATTSNILYTGQWGEPRQLDALSGTTDVVTLTIGGNDIGFSDVLESCVQSIDHSGPNGWGCSANSSITSAVQARLDSLDGITLYNNIQSVENVILAIANKAPDAKIRIAGYPHLFGSSSDDFGVSPSAPGGSHCTVAWWAGIVSVSYDDAQWINDQIDALNDIIRTAAETVDAMSSPDIDVEYVYPTPFNGHGLCDSDDPLINPLLLSGELTNPDVDRSSLHPNANGVMRYVYGFTLSL